MDCHSRITGKRGFGRSFSSGEVKRYKLSWERQVLIDRKVRKPAIRYRKELVSQIDMIVCEILALEGEIRRAEQLLDVLFELHLWRGSQEIDVKIIEGLDHLALQAGLNGTRLAGLVAERLWEMCFHFIGPSEIPMRKRDLEFVLKCVGSLSTLLQMNSEYGRGRKATLDILESAESFYEVALWYSKPSIGNLILRSYRKATAACYSDSKLEFKYGRFQIRRSLRRLGRLMDENSAKWPYQRRTVQSMLQ
jgi:hypothetical protein